MVHSQKEPCGTLLNDFIQQMSLSKISTSAPLELKQDDPSRRVWRASRQSRRIIGTSGQRQTQWAEKLWLSAADSPLKMTVQVEIRRTECIHETNWLMSGIYTLQSSSRQLDNHSIFFCWQSELLLSSVLTGWPY